MNIENLKLGGIYMSSTLQFEETKLEVISNLAKLEKNSINTILIGEISGFLKGLEWQQIFK